MSIYTIGIGPGAPGGPLDAFLDALAEKNFGRTAAWMSEPLGDLNSVSSLCVARPRTSDGRGASPENHALRSSGRATPQASWQSTV